jgi:hypothetical protein
VLPEELEDLPLTNRLCPESEPEDARGSTRSMHQSPSALKKTGTSSAQGSTRSGNVAVLPSKKSSGSMRGVRGDRVRGGGTRVTSTVALERHQVRQSPSSSRRLDADEDSAGTPVIAVAKRHSMNIIDDGTIETLDSKAVDREREREKERARRAASKAQNVGGAGSEDKGQARSDHRSSKYAEVAPAPEPVADNNFDADVDEMVDDADGEEWYDEDFEEECELPCNDAKSTEESEAVKRLQSFAVKKHHTSAAIAPVASAREAKLEEAGVEESKDDESAKDEWDLDPEVGQDCSVAAVAVGSNEG